MAGDVDIEPARRLLQAVCFPGHALLLHGRRIVLSTGSETVLAGLERLAEREPEEQAFTVVWQPELMACVQRQAFHTLIVVVPREMESARVHDKMRSALALYAAPTRSSAGTPSGGGGGSCGGGSSGGGSGAPAEVFAERVRPRPN